MKLKLLSLVVLFLSVAVYATDKAPKEPTNTPAQAFELPPVTFDSVPTLLADKPLCCWICQGNGFCVRGCGSVACSCGNQICTEVPTKKKIKALNLDASPQDIQATIKGMNY